VNFAPGRIPLGGKSAEKGIYSVSAQKTAKHRAKFQFAGVPQTGKPISGTNGPMLAIL